MFRDIIVNQPDQELALLFNASPEEVEGHKDFVFDTPNGPIYKTIAVFGEHRGDLCHYCCFHPIGKSHYDRRFTAYLPEGLTCGDFDEFENGTAPIIAPPCEWLKDTRPSTISSTCTMYDSSKVSDDLLFKLAGLDKDFPPHQRLAASILESLLHGALFIWSCGQAHVEPTHIRNIIELFHSHLNDKGAQLLLFTDDISLMDYLLPEQIFIHSKEVETSLGRTPSTLHSLIEFKNIHEFPSLSKAYLQGRFGGIPYAQPGLIPGVIWDGDNLKWKNR